MRVKKINSIIIATILLVMISFNYSLAATLSGLNGVQTILGMGSGAVNTEISLTLDDMRNRNNKNLYCIQYKNDNSSRPHTYKVLTYIEISDGIAKVWDKEGLNGASSGYKRENKILAEILSGKYGKTGYSGVSGGYSPTQKALYEYWNTWVAAVGCEVGTNETWNNQGELNDPEGAEIVNKATAAVDSGQVNPSAQIYLLNEWGGAGQAWQRLMIAQASSIEEPDDPPPNNTNYDGYIKIRGRVWVDGSEKTKSGNINGTYGDSGESVPEGEIIATLCDSSGAKFDDGSSATVDPTTGEYEIIVNLDPRKVYKLYDEPNYVHDKLMNGAYVKFEYNGMLYTTVAASNTGNNTSKATEEYGIRAAFDKANATVNPDTGTPNSSNMVATTKSMFTFGSYPYTTTDDENPTIVWCYGDGQPTRVEGDGAIPSTATYLVTNDEGEWLEPETFTGQLKHVTYTHWVDDLSRPIYETPLIGRDPVTNEPIYGEPYFTGRYEQKICHKDLCTSGHSVETTPITNLIIYDVNLGLFEREQPDIALMSDIDRVEVIMNNQQYTYKYKSQIGEPKYDDENHFGTVKFQNKYIYTYRRPVNPADIAYINDTSSGAAKEALKIYVTYKVKLSNQSNTLGVTVHKLVSDYDLEYTVVTDSWEPDKDATIAKDWNTDSDDKNKERGYKKSIVSKDLNIKLNPGEIKTVEVKYKISETAIKGLIAEDATLSNVFEIHTYSTQYGSGTLYAEQRTGGRTGNAYAGRDWDSQPGNARAHISPTETVNDDKVLAVTSEQDDTDIAPSFIIELAKEYKTIAGTVFEDTNIKDDGQRLGNGAKDNKEVGVKDVRVELWDLDLNEGKGGIATIYGIQDGKPISYKAVTYTDKDGNFSFGENNDKFDNSFGVVVNNYCIKYVYGNDDIKEDGKNVATTINEYAINARNYKSTIVTKNPIKDIMQGKEVEKSNKWHLLDGVDGTTTAVDNLDIRKDVDKNLKYDNFNEPNNMEANSKPFEMQVEYTIDPWAEVDYKGNNSSLKNTCSTFDFGIIERPREDLVIDKSITKIRITLANGQILIDGNPRTDKLDYTKVLGLKDIIKTSSQAENARDKLVAIEMDSEYIQGATLEVWYAIQIINNSDIDYDYNVSEKYYYYGDPVGKQIKNHVVTVADYIDPEFVVEKEEVTIEGTDTKVNRNKDWEIVDANTLCADGYISTITKEQLLAEKYIVLKTEYFKDKELPTADELKDNPEKFPPVELYASKLLANQEDSLTFENHTEIVEINGKVARTIDSVETTNEERIQNIKEYKPGDYVPNETREYDENKNKEIISSIEPIEKAGLHEQDDDMVKITITPPTGLGNNIMICIITAVIALTITGIGIYFIKKKVL